MFTHTLMITGHNYLGGSCTLRPVTHMNFGGAARMMIAVKLALELYRNHHPRCPIKVHMCYGPQSTAVTP